MRFRWNEEKNERLMKTRGVGFGDVTIAFEVGNILEVIEHHNPESYEGQKIILLWIDDYVYRVPCLYEGSNTWFLKTMYPSRKDTKRFNF